MNSYELSCPKPWQHFISIRYTFAPKSTEVVIHLPYWRPGRYEAGNFAANILGFRVVDEGGNDLQARKISANSWKVLTAGKSRVKVQYQYYASAHNAGSTYLDEERLIVNPVNCLVYAQGHETEPCSLKMDMPGNWAIASGMKLRDKTLLARDIQQLFDCPILAAPSLQKLEYKVGDATFFIWIDGKHHLNVEALIEDFEKFTKAQVTAFGSIPVEEYHFLLSITPYKSYHGVEHENSTMMIIGPADQLAERRLYLELLGLSSHELYHTWNVKYLRPAEWSPYDFTRPVHSRLGYVAEGVTTYYGDVMLWRGGCFSDEEFLTQLAGQFQKHYENGGRKNLSVADSSFDTWVDGYSRGTPNRKVSIYTEGCLIAFICDAFIMRSTGNRHSLNDVLRGLYQKFGYSAGGYSEEDYWHELSGVAPSVDWLALKSAIVDAPGDYTPYLTEALSYFQLKLDLVPEENFIAGHWGIKLGIQNGNAVVINVHPGSVAEQARLWFGDTITDIDGQKLTADPDATAAKLAGEEVELSVQTPYQQRTIRLKAKAESIYFGKYRISGGGENFEAWKGCR